MTRAFPLFVFSAAHAVLLCSAVGKPMDSKAAEKLPALRLLVQEVKSGVSLNDKELALLQECLHQSDPVLVAVAAWCIERLGSKADELQAKLANIPPSVGDMARAFVTLAQESKRLRSYSNEQRIARYAELTKDSNPYLRIEAAKALTTVDPVRGKSVLSELARKEDKQTQIDAKRALRAMDVSDQETATAKLPYRDEQYETVLSIVDDSSHHSK